jgi:hypothetical protein
MRLMRTDAVKSAVAVTGSFLVVLAIGTIGWAMLRPDPSAASATWRAAAGTASGSPTLTPTPDAVPTTSAPTPTRTPTPKAVKATASKKVLPKPTATVKPPAAERPPAPQPKPNPSPGCVPTYSGPKAPVADVKAALIATANHQYWVGVRPPPELEGKQTPTITVPVDLMKAIAWQESGWQSTIIACDGGVGTMQIMPGTVTQVNNRFGENFDVNTLQGNTSIGAAYIEWLIMYFGLYYFSQNFDLTTVAAVGPGGAQLQLLDVVLAAYNVGPGTLEVGTNTLSIPSVGQKYADNVKALRGTSCPCQTY